MVICPERGADLHLAQLMPLPLTVSCVSKIQIGFTFLVPAHPGSPGKRAVKRACACVASRVDTAACVRLFVQSLTGRSSRAEVLSCSFYNALHDRRANALYSVRFPLADARCRHAEWRRYGRSPGARRRCLKWFVGSRGRGGGVAVVRDRATPRRALTVVDNGVLARLRRLNERRVSDDVFPPIHVDKPTDALA